MVKWNFRGWETSIL